MNVLDNMVSTLDMNMDVQDIHQGVFHTGVWTHYCDLAANSPQDAFIPGGPPVGVPEVLLDKTPKDFARKTRLGIFLDAPSARQPSIHFNGWV